MKTSGSGNKPGRKRKYNKEIVRKICSMISLGDYPIMTICKAVRIHHDTYYEWLKDIPEFRMAIEKALTLRFSTYVATAREGLLTLLKGKEWDETTTEYVYVGKGANRKKVIKSEKVTSKFILPNVVSIIYTLKTLDKDNFEELKNKMLPDSEPEDNELKVYHIHSNVPLANDEDQVLIENGLK